MPPRKSDLSKVITGTTDDASTSTAKDATSTSTGTPAKKEKDPDGINIEDLNLPKSIVTRLAKGVLPPNTQIQGNAMLALSKSATVFVNYLATHANEYAQGANRKTIAPADVFKALEDLEFDFKERLEAELAKFNEIQTDKRNTYRKKVAADKATKSGSPVPGKGEGESVESNGVPSEAADGPPAAKRVRMDVDADIAGNDNETEDASDLIDEAEGDADLAEEGDEEVEEDVEDVDEDDENPGEAEGDDPPDDALEEPGEHDIGDEALDNGEDSD